MARGRSPISPIACRMKSRFTGGIRSTNASPASRASRTGSRSLANSRLMPSVTATNVIPSNRRHAAYRSERLRLARIKSEPKAIDHDLRYRGNIPQGQVPSLAGDGMDAPCGVSHQHGATGRVAIRQDQRQWVGPASARQGEIAQIVTEALRELGEECLLIQGQHRRTEFDRRAPTRSSSGCPSWAGGQKGRRERSARPQNPDAASRGERCTRCRSARSSIAAPKCRSDRG